MAVQTQDDAENKNFTKNDIQTEIKNDATIDKTDEKSDKNDEISPQKTIAITTIGFKLQPKTSQNTQNSTDPHPTAALSPHALAAIMAQFSAHFSLKPDSDGFAQNFYAEISKRSETDLFSDEDLAIGVAISARKSDLDVLGRLVAVLLTKRTGIIVLNEIVKWILNFQNQHKNGDKSSGHNHRKNGDKNDQKKNGKKHQNEPEKAHEMVKNDEVSEKMRKSAEHVLAKTRHRVVKKFAVFGGYDLAGDALGVTELPLELFVLLLSADQILTDAENSVWLVAAYWVLKNVPRVAFAAAGGAGALEAKRVFGALRLYRMDKSYLFNVVCVF